MLELKTEKLIISLTLFFMRDKTDRVDRLPENQNDQS